MAIPWLVLLQTVPWTEVIKNAPKVAEGAKKLWSSVGSKSVEQYSTGDGVEQPSSSVSISELHARLTAMEHATADLHSQMLDSAELIKTLAEQNAELIRRIEINSKRMAWLLSVTLFFGVTAAVSLFVIFAQ